MSRGRAVYHCAHDRPNASLLSRVSIVLAAALMPRHEGKPTTLLTTATITRLCFSVASAPNRLGNSQPKAYQYRPGAHCYSPLGTAPHGAGFPAPASATDGLGRQHNGLYGSPLASVFTGPLTNIVVAGAYHQGLTIRALSLPGLTIRGLPSGAYHHPAAAMLTNIVVVDAITIAAAVAVDVAVVGASTLTLLGSGTIIMTAASGMASPSACEPPPSGCASSPSLGGD